MFRDLSFFGGTAEIMKEIVGRGPSACRPEQGFYEARAPCF
jgi:hypothetical protein